MQACRVTLGCLENHCKNILAPFNNTWEILFLKVKFHMRANNSAVIYIQRLSHETTRTVFLFLSQMWNFLSTSSVDKMSHFCPTQGTMFAPHFTWLIKPNAQKTRTLLKEVCKEFGSKEIFYVLKIQQKTYTAFFLFCYFGCGGGFVCFFGLGP